MKPVRRLVTLTFAAATLAGFGAETAAAFPLGTSVDGAAFSAAPSARELARSGVDFTAIVALSDCSGALVRFKSSKPEEPALVLTNGHCYEGGFPSPGQVLVNQPSSRTFDLLSADASSTVATLSADMVLYATMTNTDVTLYRLSSTFADVKSQYGVDALTIADHHPEAGAPIRVVSGYWKKIYSCAIDRFVFELDEGGYVNKDSLLYKQPGCETIGGTSGSPVIHADTKEIIGINNTGNESGERCTENNPCEVDAGGNVTVTQGAAYGQQTYLFYGCLSAANQLDLTLPGCSLPKPVAL